MHTKIRNKYDWLTRIVSGMRQCCHTKNVCVAETKHVYFENNMYSDKLDHTD
jgi:hypothetical protein